jgi:hypothetical protein
MVYCGGVALALLVSPSCSIQRKTLRQQFSFRIRKPHDARRTIVALQNLYDDWRADAVVVDTMHLDEENVISCLDEFINSDYGQQMFGCHDRIASVGVTGEVEFVELCGPEVTLQLSGKFWHRRSTVLGRAAMWLNARIPEITEVTVADREELMDTTDIRDEFGELIVQEDKRSPDFNGDRATMEYQGIDPDMRGPFPQSGRIEFN